MTNRPFQTFLFMFLAGIVSASVTADVVYDESVDGDLSSDNFNPTAIIIGSGSNEILGTTTFNPLDRDFFVVNVPTGFELSQVILQTYITTELQSFMAVESGGQITSLGNTTNLLGNALIGFDTGSQQGDDILDDLGTAQFGGTGFTGPLPSGTYTFWFQETGADTEYAFNFIVSAVPEPGSASIAIALAMGLMIRRKK